MVLCFYPATTIFSSSSFGISGLLDSVELVVNQMLSQNGSDTDSVPLNISKKLTMSKIGAKCPSFAKCIFATFFSLSLV